VASLLVYDGDCGFCTRCVEWALARLPYRPAVVAWQHADLGGLGVTRAEAEHSVLWVEPSGRVSSGHVAVARLLVASGGAWALLGRLAMVPPVSWIAAAAYRLVAVNRGRLPGGTPACALPADQRPGSQRAG
jgi:predicted DCC family thiol-disulfide oxidoreductase YuxK